MKHLFLINPAAGKRGSTDALCRQIRETFAGLGLDYEIFLGAAPGDCERRARAAAESGEPVRLYACGGDGTLNEVVNAAAGFDNAAVTNVPKGTGNDFLKLFGPTYRTAFSDLAALASGPQAAFDLMDCNGRLGIDVCCAGVDARIAADVHKYKALPFLNGMAAYSASLVVNVLFKGLSRPTVIRAGDAVLYGESTIICISCRWGTPSPTTECWTWWWCPGWAASPFSASWGPTPRAATGSTRRSSPISTVRPSPSPPPRS